MQGVSTGQNRFRVKESLTENNERVYDDKNFNLPEINKIFILYASNT
jgi:hypothetical protein